MPRLLFTLFPSCIPDSHPVGFSKLLLTANIPPDLPAQILASTLQVFLLLFVSLVFLGHLTVRAL